MIIQWDSQARNSLHNSQSNISTTQISLFHFLLLSKVLCWAPIMLRTMDKTLGLQGSSWIFFGSSATSQSTPLFSPATLGIFQILKNTQISLTPQGLCICCFLFLETSCLYLDNSSEENLSLTSETELDFLNMSSRSITLDHKYMLNYLFSPTDYKLGTLLIPVCILKNPGKSLNKYLLNE